MLLQTIIERLQGKHHVPYNEENREWFYWQCSNLDDVNETIEYIKRTYTTKTWRQIQIELIIKK